MDTLLETKWGDFTKYNKTWLRLYCSHQSWMALLISLLFFKLIINIKLTIILDTFLKTKQGYFKKRQRQDSLLKIMLELINLNLILLNPKPISVIPSKLIVWTDY